MCVQSNEEEYTTLFRVRSAVADRRGDEEAAGRKETLFPSAVVMIVSVFAKHFSVFIGTCS